MIKILAKSTPSGWTDAVLANFSYFLQDHAANEKKASAMAMTFVSHYPDKPELVREMIAVAQEELEHFGEVVALLQARALALAPDEKDPYVGALLREQRKGDGKYYLLDRLLIAALVEARGQERFTLVGLAHSETDLKEYYVQLAKSEARHHATFLRLAKRYYDEATVDARLSELSMREAEILDATPWTGRLH